MRVGIVGKKIGMTQIFTEDGSAVPVTVIEASDCFITQVKTRDKDGYSALQVGFDMAKPQNVTSALKGHFKKANVPAKKKVMEIRVEDEDTIRELTPGKALAVNMFAKGDVVDVTGISKGKGFQGVMKRHHFKGAKASHGAHTYFRHGGSVGSNTFPGRIFKNKGMPGQMGNVKRTVQNLTLVDIHPKEKLLLIKGSVPGSSRSYVLVSTSIKGKQPDQRAWVR